MNRDRLFTLGEIASGEAAAKLRRDPRSKYQILLDIIADALPSDPVAPADVSAVAELLNNIHLATHLAQIEILKRLKEIVEIDPSFGV